MSDVVVKNVVEELNLEVIYGNSYLDKKVSKMMSSRPSVEIYSGYFDYFESDRMQVIGTKELTLFNMLSTSLKKERLEKLSKKNRLFKIKEKKQEPAPEPETKICPFCFSEINYKAVKCPHCTSDLN